MKKENQFGFKLKTFEIKKDKFDSLIKETERVYKLDKNLFQVNIPRKELWTFYY
jgi:hypothetical protein